ncbi:methyltransferase domain protein [Rickettsia amblyommatis str. Ac/Pa]|uniref:Methyltransferase domain protein n=1 Tax=Rickettsia amblyommatis str. Ac/Pa TaxID=1359164 RepID=A0A0F3N288_RICAM|nr:methyltransferase domain protein [Rickettsia amblyommatis str. Ac/Pa]
MLWNGTRNFHVSDILGVEITAIDISKESIIYAEQNYGASNIQYIKSDLISFIKKTEEYDYIVSRHVLEHIEDGLNLALNLKYKKRLIVNVPFNEPEGNIHHLVNCITEKDFESYPNKEFFYKE